ncbi:MAG: ribonuclease D [Pirellulales bacterium]|jgi:ribonuclease D
MPEGIYRHITTQAELDHLVGDLAAHPFLAFDTEFVSEHTYRSHLCLVQIAAPGLLAVIDALELPNLEPFWRLLAEEGRTTVVHAGREELGFILHAIGTKPSSLFDVQVAAGLVDHDFPAGYAALCRRMLGVNTSKGETRTDWRVRPLSEAQMQYALDDVRHLERLWQLLEGKLAKLGRSEWMVEEMASWQDDVAESFERKRWRRVSGLNGLSRRELAVARELWHWRDRLAEQRNMPPKRVLRDDLLVELAKRRSADERQIKAIRGMQRSDFRHIIEDISKAIATGLNLPEDECPGGERHRAPPPQLAMLGQFLATAIAGLCRQMNIAPSLVGTASDMRDLLAYKLGYRDDEQPPVLSVGWRADLVGTIVDDLLEGRSALRIGDPRSSDPLVIESVRPL